MPLRVWSIAHTLAVVAELKVLLYAVHYIAIGDSLFSSFNMSATFSYVIFAILLVSLERIISKVRAVRNPYLDWGGGGGGGGGGRWSNY